MDETNLVASKECGTHLITAVITVGCMSCFMYHALPTKEHLLSLAKPNMYVGVRELEAELK